MVLGVAKRLLVGRPMQSDRLGHTLLPKRIALPVFASDALSSVAYATEEILIVLSVGGIAFFSYTPWIALAVGVLMLVVVASYRQNVHAYPSGGGDYEVVTTNLGHTAGLTVASALMVDYVLTVAVSMASAMSNIGSAVPFIGQHKVLFAVAAILILASLNLRGIRESGTAFAIPTYAFMIGMYIMIGWGLFQIFVLGDHLQAESAQFTVKSEHGDVLGFAMIFLVARAFSSGCAALTGVEAISNGVPAFRKPKSRNAASTLLLLGVIAVSLFMGIIVLAKETGVKVADTVDQLGGAPAGYHPKTLIAQLADAVFHDFPIGLYAIAGVTALILILAANTAFNGFPVLGSILAQDRFLPRQLSTRGDRLAFSNGILFLAFAAIAFVVAFRAEVTALIQLYIVGVFVSFTLSQIGMVRHWTRLLRVETDSAERRSMHRARVINTIGCICTGTVLLVVVVTKFLAGAWIAILAMGFLFVVMKMIHKHYATVALELEAQAADKGDVVLPSRNHAIVLVSNLHLPTLRALAYAKATRPDVLEAIHVSVDDREARELQSKWEDSEHVTVPLKVIASPYRDITRPLLDYVKRITKESRRTVVTVFIPEYVVGHWWEQVLHNQSALRLKGRLLFEPQVMVTSVPWQLSSSDRLKHLLPQSAPGDARRGFLD